MIAPFFFFFIGVFVAYSARRKGAPWALRAGLCMILMAPVSYLISRPEAQWTVVPGLLLTSGMIFCLVVSVVRGEPKYKAES